ncbi:hypothetical protein HU200_054803 [Digitaria exilis]|uniref:Major facilitator superfamily (MFS) profile domain-containing protein n=1 Tax=Digitaria exilis TaxID=1010633 RepID=A0A835E569_9POAL|nr:hypothetical protein HU200_054803 [Digitaria exilis]CAB3458438.1 unnamed protein product [Digitaria exilis]
MASTTLPETVEAKKRRNVKYVVTCAVLACTTSIILGYDVAVMSGASLYIKKEMKITDVQLEMLMGIISLCSPLGSFAAGRTCDWIGRRYTVVLTGGIFFAAALLMGFSVNYPMLMVGQCVAGIGGGYALTIAPVYTAEISPASARGLLTSFLGLSINFGAVLGYVSNYVFAHLPLHLGWRIMLGISAAPSILTALLVFGMPESPRWLVMKGRLADAKAVLDKISDTSDEVAERLADIKAAAGIPANLDGDVVPVPGRDRGEEKRVWKELVFSPTPAMRRILLSAIVLNFLHQASGIDSVVLYTPRVFMSAGITDSNRLLGMTCAVGVVKLLSIFVATFLLDRVGRSPLLLSSTGGMIVSLVGLGVGLTVVGHHPGTKITWAVALCVVSNLAFVSFFSIGLGPIAFVYTSEIFPLRVRALGCAISMATNRFTGGVVTMTFLSLSKAITIGGSFFLYAGIAAIAWVFFYTYLPETRGRTLEEIGKLFGMAGDTGPEAEGEAAKVEVEMPTK